jgi:hypothetical protein
VQIDFFNIFDFEKVKSILEIEKWTKINVQKRISQKSLEKPKTGSAFF